MVLAIYLWTSSNSCLFITHFWRRKKKQLQTFAAEPSSGLKLESSDLNEANFCLGCGSHSFSHLKNPPGTDTWANLHLSPLGPDWLGGFLKQKPRGVTQWGFSFPCRTSWTGSPEKKKS